MGAGRVRVPRRGPDQRGSTAPTRWGRPTRRTARRSSRPSSRGAGCGSARARRQRFTSRPRPSISPHRIVTDNGTVSADFVVRATEGYTPTLEGQTRAVAPVYSLIIATAPLPESVWDQIGLARRETFTDFRHLIIYGQRTADDRIVFGGRGAPYHFGSRIKPEYDTHARVHRSLRQDWWRCSPCWLAPITHRWGGNLGIARDWHASVGLDASTGMGWAGGYVGDGVTTTEPRGPHAARPDSRRCRPAHVAAVGGPRRAMGGRAGAVARGQRGAFRHDARGHRGANHASRACSRAHGALHGRPLTEGQRNTRRTGSAGSMIERAGPGTGATRRQRARGTQKAPRRAAWYWRVRDSNPVATQLIYRRPPLAAG